MPELKVRGWGLTSSSPYSTTPCPSGYFPKQPCGRQGGTAIFSPHWLHLWKWVTTALVLSLLALSEQEEDRKVD